MSHEGVLVNTVAFVALSLTYLSFLSGARVCHTIVKSGTCGHLSPAPFLAGLLCTVMWLNYSLIANEEQIYTVNCFGFICQTIYLCFFISYSKNRRRVIVQTVITFFLIALLIYISRTNGSNNLKFSGTFASTASLIACASPLATLKDVIRTKNVSSMPFPMVLSSFIVSLSWFLLGYLLEDYYIFLTNLCTTCLVTAQLSLFAIYPSETKYQLLSPVNKKSVDLINDMMDSDPNLPRIISTRDEDLDPNKNYTIVLNSLVGQYFFKAEKIVRTREHSAVLLALFSLLN